jgi:hypothetical protein
MIDFPSQILALVLRTPPRLVRLSLLPALPDLDVRSASHIVPMASDPILAYNIYI